MQAGTASARVWSAVIIMVICFLGEGCCMLMGGFGGLYTLKLPLSVRVVDETTGEPISGAVLTIDWRCGPLGWDWGESVQTKTSADGWGSIENIPYVLANGNVVSERPRKLVYLERIFSEAEGYTCRTLTGTRLYNRGLHGLTISLRRNGYVDKRTVPIDVWVVEVTDGRPVPEANVWLMWEWIQDGIRWSECFKQEKTDMAGHVRFHWTPPACFPDAESAWKKTGKSFNMCAFSYGSENRWGCGFSDMSTNVVVLKLTRSWYGEKEYKSLGQQQGSHFQNGFPQENQTK